MDTGITESSFIWMLGGKIKKSSQGEQWENKNIFVHIFTEEDAIFLITFLNSLHLLNSPYTRASC